MTASRGIRACSPRGSALALLLFSLLACTSPQGASGDALGEGAQSAGVIGSDLARVGQKWNIALPLMYNRSAEGIQVTAAEVGHVPQGIKILGYGAYDRNDTEGVALISRVGSPGMPDLDTLENHATRAISIGPGTESAVYFVVKVEITGNITENITGTTFTYTSGEHTYTQSLPFEASLRLEGSEP